MMSSYIRRRLFRLVTYIVCGALGYFARIDIFEEVTNELLALFGLMMAGVLPTMILTSSALRAANLSIKEINAYGDALRRQLDVWIGLFFISFMACAFLITCKIFHWSIIVQIPLSFMHLKNIQFEALHFFNVAIAVSIALIVVRSLSVGEGIISLLNLSRDLALSETRARDEERHRIVEKQIASLPERSGFGVSVDLPH